MEIIIVAAKQFRPRFKIGSLSSSSHRRMWQTTPKPIAKTLDIVINKLEIFIGVIPVSITKTPFAPRLEVVIRRLVSR